MAVMLSEDSQNRFLDVFRRQLKHFRKEILRCSQEEAATKLNISPQYYKSLERGVAFPSLKMLIQMAEESDFRVDYLFLNLWNDAKGKNKSQEQLVLEQINNTCSDSDRRAMIYFWNMYVNPKNKSGFRIVEESSVSSELDTPTPAKRKRSKKKTD